jgi:hypothetical protein
VSAPRRRGGDRGKAAATNTINTADFGNAQPTDAPPIWTIGYPPAGRRSRWLLIVQRCDACSAAHSHYGGLNGGIRRRGCGAGGYDLRVRTALAVAG